MSPYVVIAAVVAVGLLLFVAAMGGRDWAQTQVRYFVYAFLYVIFAVDAVYLFPWALVVRSNLGAASLVDQDVRRLRPQRGLDPLAVAGERGAGGGT